MRKISKRFIFIFVLTLALLLTACANSGSNSGEPVEVNNVVDVTLNENNELVFEMEDGTFITAGEIPSAVSVRTVSVNPNGRLIIVLTNNQVFDLGIVVGEDGYQGNDGENGVNGLSAFEIYLKNYPGYEGTEKDWIDEFVLGGLALPIVLNLDGGVLEAPATIMKGDKFQLAATKDGYVFENWVDGTGKIHDADEPVLAAIDFTAVWHKAATWKATGSTKFDQNGLLVEFELLLGETSLDLTEMTVQKLNGKEVELDEATLWFDATNRAGTYMYEFEDAVERYRASLVWSGNLGLDTTDFEDFTVEIVGDKPKVDANTNLVYQPYKVTTDLTFSADAVAYNINSNGYAQKAFIDVSGDDIMVGLNANTFTNPQVAGKHEIVVFDNGDWHVVEVESSQREVARVGWTSNDEYVVNFDQVETDIVKLESAFINDWNVMFGTDFVKFRTLEFHSHATEEITSIWGGSGPDLSGYNIYKFFNDSEMSEKWMWMLDYVHQFSYETWTRAQITAIKGDGTFPGEAALYFGEHMMGSISNLFGLTAGASLRGAGAGNFSATNPAVDFEGLHTIVNNMDYELHYSGDTINLPDAFEQQFYSFDHYFGNSRKYEANEEITLGRNITFVPIMVVDEFTAKFFDGTTELTDFEKTYDYKDNFDLPTYEKDGYVFNGWFDNAEFAGDPFEKLPLEMEEDVNYYAKFTESPYNNVEITLDLDGGFGDVNSLVNKYKDAAGYVVSTGNRFATGFPITTTVARPGNYWFIMSFTKTDTNGVYTLNSKGVPANGDEVLDSDLFIAYHDAITSTFKSAMAEIYSNIAVGDVLLVPEFPEDFETIVASDTAFEIDLYFITAEEASEDIVFKSYDPLTLGVPTKEGFVFDGWFENADFSGDAVTEFPGYLIADSDVTEVTYYAKWSPVS